MTDTLRPISLGDRTRTRGRKAERPALTWLPVPLLRLDDSYQRPLGRGNWKGIEAIAAEFDWARFTPILAAPIDGGLYAIIDGQHRTHAAALRGFDHVPAMVVPMTHAEQARAFAWVNGQVTAITIFHIYKAAMAAMEPWALEACRVVEAAGCKLMTYPVGPGNKKGREIYMIGLIREHVEAGRGDMVTAVLSALSRTNWGDTPYPYTNSVLKPLLASLVLLGDWRRVDLDGFLRANDVVALRDDVAAMQKARPGLAQHPPSKVYRETLLALLRRHVGATAAAAE